MSRQLIQWRLKTAIKNAKWYCERGRYVQRFLGGLSAVAGWTDGISCSGGGLSAVQFSAPVSFTNHTGVTFTNTTTGDTGSVSSVTTTGSTVIEYTVTWVVAGPVYGDVIVYNYDSGTGNYTDEEGEAIGDQTLIMFSCHDLVYIPGSIYSGTKDTSTDWLVEKLATGVNTVKIENQTVQMIIGFTDDPLVEPTNWVNYSLVSPTYIRTTGAYVGWYSAGIGTFDLEQSVTRLINIKEGSIYSGLKDTTTNWLAEKLATDVNMIRISGQTADISIGFTSDPTIEPVDWVNYGTDSPPYIFTLDSYVAWKSSASDTFLLEQTVAR